MTTSRPAPAPQPSPRGLLAAALCLAGLCAWSPPSRAADEGFSAEMVGQGATPPNAVADEPAALPDLDPQGVVTIFELGCLSNAGRPAAAIDWALANDFAPAGPERGVTDGLLDGQPGTVLVAPGTDGRVLLAVSENQCTVWAERTAGPPLRAALSSLVVTLLSKGHKAHLVTDRTVEKAGAWRNQLQWRYRAVGETQERSLGLVTTLAPTQQGTQVLRLAPAAPVSHYAPDGVPVPVPVPR
jgi:hypothetical protein